MAYKNGISIVMPCLNEEATIGSCIDKAMSFIRKCGMDGEVIVADNGSTDHSVSIAGSRDGGGTDRSCERKRIRVSLERRDIFSDL